MSDSPTEHVVEWTWHAVQVQREHQRPGVLRLAARAGADEAAQVLDRAASPLSGLRLQAAQRWELALRPDDALDAKGPDQLVLEVGDADVEAEAPGWRGPGRGRSRRARGLARSRAPRARLLAFGFSIILKEAATSAGPSLNFTF